MSDLCLKADQIISLLHYSWILLGVSVLSNSLLYLSLTDLVFMQLHQPKKHWLQNFYFCKCLQQEYYTMRRIPHIFPFIIFISYLLKRKLAFQIRCWATGLFLTWYSNMLFQCNFWCLLKCSGKVFSDHTANILLGSFHLQVILLDGLLCCHKNGFCWLIIVIRISVTKGFKLLNLSICVAEQN